MSNDLIAVVGFLAVFGLMALRIPVGIAMGIVGTVGFASLAGLSPALKILGQSPFRTAVEDGFTVIPMFLLMGAVCSASGMSRELFRAANAFVGHLKGGLGIATIGACGGFSALCGSSVATAATFSTVAYPEMRRYQYPRSFAAGVIAAGGTLGILIPPSTVLAIYAVMTDQDIGRLFVAGILPGLLAIAMYTLTVVALAWVRKDYLPAGDRATWQERIAAVRDIWAISLLFIFVIAGLYGGMFTATEAGAMGAAGAIIISFVRRRMDRTKLLQCLVEAFSTTASIFTILIGALIFGYFLAITQAPQKLTMYLTDMGLGSYQVLLLILLMYLILGCIMDAMAMIVLTVPLVYPVILALGFDPIWFGIILVMVVELGLITPPVGMNAFVIRTVVPDLPLKTIFTGLMPFIVTDVLRLAILILFPGIVLLLPGLMGN